MRAEPQCLNTRVWYPTARRCVRVLGVVIVLLGAYALTSLAWLAREVAQAPLPRSALASAALPARLGAAPEPLRFAVMGDPERNRAVFRACLQAARAQGCAFVIVLGDLVKDAYPLVFRLFLDDLRRGGYGEAFAVVRGNHDDPQQFQRLFGSSNWWFRLGHALFVGLCGEDGPAAAREALADALAARAPLDRVLVFSHIPILPYQSQREVDRAEQSGAQSTAMATLRSLITHGHVDHVFAAHFHGFEQTELDGIAQTITGGAGAHLKGNGARHHLVVVDLHPDAVQVRRVDIDSTAWSELGATVLLERSGLDLYDRLASQPVTWIGSAVLVILLELALLLATRRPPA
ncbi:MAG: metallophosphoesterase [Planctomycetota bacterium]